MSTVPGPEPLVEILTSLRERVLGVTETVVSTADGLLVAADADTVQPESVAALSAATHSIGRRMAHEVGGGELGEVTARSAGRHVVVQAVGERALLTVLGDDGLDLAGLRREVPAVVEQLAEILAADAPVA
ncbi:roadblock/LC7 domain-containing protein [Streptomyces zingiberis]|uniref:Dynein regulation protein LC7 n=1 Tax=Streptomyces zingiberis TaxID=2053010 RepID=A0ABX1BZC3_9ACTN|nr:roadblock/LC7 domain-containing protein [Streptomyces zingiberis]NJQ01042.1 dynein regulation protein LC7 [Streptomyces zingiberis]